MRDPPTDILDVNKINAETLGPHTKSYGKLENHVQL